MTEKLTKCAACNGRGYHRCECWPGDCICGQDEETCFECEGEGLIDQTWDDDFGVPCDEPEPPSPQPNVVGRWLPIAQADKTITNVEDFSEVGVILRTSDRYWVRDEDGRVYEAAWSEGNNGERDYWWDFEGESPVDPVEFMPHPLDLRFAALATTEGQDNG